MSSSICQHFTQNAWKKDLCSNCFKSKDEHKQAAAAAAAAGSKLSNTTKKNFSLVTSPKVNANTKTDYPNKHKTPIKSSIKKVLTVRSTSKSSSKPHKVSFQKQLHEVIGYGGEWPDNDSDDDNDDDHDFMNLGNEHDDMAATETDDEETLEMKRVTRANTDFNMNNGNLLGDAQENIKKSFAALKLGAPQVDKEGKKQTLKISVVPFGVTATMSPTAATATTIITTAMPENIKATTSTTTVQTKFETKPEPTVAKIIASSKQTSATGAATISTTTAATTIPSTTAIKSTKRVTTTLTPTIKLSTMSTTTSTIGTATTTRTSTAGASVAKSTTVVTPVAADCDGKYSPPIERAMEKSLLDEISETLEQQQNESKKLALEKETTAAAAVAAKTPSKIKFELTSLSETLENKPFLDLKKPIARNAPITKDHAKPKVNVFHKYSDSDSNCSDTENGVSAYYDVVESQISYENMPDGNINGMTKTKTGTQQSEGDNKSLYSSSQYITDMLLSSKTRAASYNLHEGNFMTSKITSDGLIVTKCSSDDALDSTGSSFDGSSDEETSYNMIRSESDSGIGISIGSEYKNINANEKEHDRLRVEKKLSVSTNNSDYEDIQVVEQASKSASKSALGTQRSDKLPNAKKSTYVLDKSRELHGEPDGSADPDGSLENKEPSPQQLPALPKSPPPTKIDARPSFLHGLQKQQPPLLLKKPDLPAKPLVSPVNSPLKTFMSKRQPSSAEQQLINQLQTVISKSSENLAAESPKDDAKLKKGRAPNPPPEQKTSAPPTPERDYNTIIEFETATSQTKQEEPATPSNQQLTTILKSNVVGDASVRTEIETGNTNATSTTTTTTSDGTSTTPTSPTSSVSSSSIYTRKPPVNMNGNNNAPSPVIREKDKRERATINPKFRSLNTFVTQRSNATKNLQLQSATSAINLKQPMTPEPTPRHQKNLSASQECLNANAGSADKKSTATTTTPTIGAAAATQKTKTKFSIKKFLRMGAGKTNDNIHKKDTVYTEICTGDDAGVVGKPRLVIIHPIDINPTAVEVVKDITKTSDTVTAQTVAVVTAKPPAPPLRTNDAQRAHEFNKPARPPPPKSAELRRKQKIGLTATLSAGEAGGSIKCKSDNVYANLGEIRSSIAPRKPERTASMREREAQLELARKRHIGSRNENVDTISICSSNGDNVSTEQQHFSNNSNGTNSMSSKVTTATLSMVDGKPPTGNNSRTSTFERKKNESKIAISSKLEIFEQRQSPNNGSNSDGSAAIMAADNGRPGSLKDSVRKINSTIDSYLKDKRDYENMYEYVKTAATPPPPPARTMDLSAATAAAAGQRLLSPKRQNVYSDTVSIASYTRSEYGPMRNFGFNNSLANIPRVISASYCGSEVGDIDIYSPYSYYGSEAGGDVATDINDSVWGIPSAVKNRSKATNRLRMRKGRSVVHKTIEDNYTAVVVANHEALAQVLDQLQQTPVIPPALRPLANAINLRYEDFTVLEGAQAFVVGKKAFHSALWTTAPVTLALSADCNQLAGVTGELSQLSGGVSGVLNPITEFCDLVPSYQLPLMPSTEVTLLQATISVLPRLQLETLQSIGAILKGKSQVLDKSNFNFRGSIPNLSGLKDSATGNALRNVVSVQNLSTLNEEKSITDADKSTQANATGGTMPAFDDVMTREVAFIMLQLVNGMKNLQSKAIEEMPLSLSNVVLSKDVENKDAQARLCVLQGSNNNDEEEPMGTLCKCAYIALTDMLPSTKISNILADILQQERAESLSKSKSVLEFVLWGPSDVVLSGSTKERELALQRWLDLERATVLHGLVRTRVELTVYDECHLMFLVRSTAKMMNDAAKIVCSYQSKELKE